MYIITAYIQSLILSTPYLLIYAFYRRLVF